MADSLIVFVAVCLSVTELPLYPAALRTGRWDILATYLAFASAAVWLDFAVAKRIIQLVRAGSKSPQG